MNFQNRLKRLRLHNNLTQEQLGKKINVTKVSVSGYENGTRTPDMDTLQKIADVLDVSIDYLLGRVEDPRAELDEVQRGLYDNVDVELEELKKHINFTIDGKEATDDEIKEAIAFIKMLRKLREQD